MASKVVVVTGCTSGFGRDLCVFLVNKAYKVVGLGRRAANGEALSNELGENFVFVQGDVTLETDLDRLFATATQRFGGVDALVNNAGLAGPSDQANLAAAALTSTFQTNVVGAALAATRAIEQFERRGGGVIINVSSAASFLDSSMCIFPAYVISKCANDALTRSLGTPANAAKNIFAYGLNPYAFTSEMEALAISFPTVQAMGVKSQCDYEFVINPITRATNPTSLLSNTFEALIRGDHGARSGSSYGVFPGLADDGNLAVLTYDAAYAYARMNGRSSLAAVLPPAIAGDIFPVVELMDARFKPLGDSERDAAHAAIAKHREELAAAAASK